MAKCSRGQKQDDQGSMPVGGGALIQEFIYRRKLMSSGGNYGKSEAI